jgi:hypothetical protein
MKEACVSCGVDDDILFTCRYCDRQFCAGHQFPHHACTRFGSGASASEDVDDSGFEFDSGAEDPTEAATAEPPDPAASADARTEGERPGTSVTEPSARGTSERRAIAKEADPRETPGDEPVDSTESRRREPSTAARATGAPAGLSAATPASAGVGATEGTMRPTGSERAVGVVSPASNPGTLGEWLGRQTYVSLTVKVGFIALVVNAAFYGGLALTLYDLLSWVL